MSLRPASTQGPRPSACGPWGIWLVGLLMIPLSVAGQDAQGPLRLKPTIGFGTGMFAFYGDVGRDHAGYSPLLARLGYEIRATTPITPWLEGGLYALHGRLGVNERGPMRNLNFESRITIGGFQFRYNFDQFLNPGRPVEPYINFGFESVEFLTKTDLYDDQGRAYHYWSDGSIRDMAESDPNASQASTIQRDYRYETDVRELNADDFGKYLERSWAIPIGIGARMDIAHGFDLRVGTTMHFTLTDMVDGVSDQSLGDRVGDTRNDRFLYTSFSLGYTIPLEPRKPKQKMTPLDARELDLIVLNDDEDGDAVPDIRDDCPGTPAGIPVDEHGCPLDGDGDGVPDHLDDELDTPLGVPVDARGVTLSEKDMLHAFLNFLDSGNVNTVYSRVESFGPVYNARPRPKRTYVVKVGTEVEGISEDLIQKILSIPDVRTVVQGDTTYYVVGNYDAIPEALRREMELRGIGLTGSVMAEEDGRLVDVADDVTKARSKMRGMGAGDDSRNVIVRVQLGAFRRKLSQDIFREVPDLVTLKGEDGLTRYYTGSFTNVNEAAAHKVKMVLNGFEGAFLVAFREGKRISMKDAGAGITIKEDLRTIPTGTVNKDMLRYRVQVATFMGNVPLETMGQLIELGDMKPMIGADAVRYFYGEFRTRLEAEDARKAVQAKGFSDAFVVGDMNGAIIPAEEVDRLLREP